MTLNALRTSRMAALLAALAIAPGAAVAADAAKPSAVNVSADNVVINGYDPVAYHTEQRPTRGNPAIRHAWNDAVWQFASAANRDLFAADPDRYAPRYGGFCAGGMSRGLVVVPLDPDLWVIVDGRLYLGARPSAITALKETPKETTAAADQHWKTLGAK